MRKPATSNGGRTNTILLMALVTVAIYVGRDIFIPLALAVLFSFVLAPLVSRLQRWHIHRVVSVAVVSGTAFLLVAAVGMLVTAQLVDLAASLPEHRANIRHKIQSFTPAEEGVWGRLGKSLREVQAELQPSQDVEETTSDHQAPPAPPPVPVRIIDSPAMPIAIVGSLVASLAGPIATAGLVLIFVVFILIRWEDLRDRLIRLVGAGRISATTKALTDAGQRVSRYLLMQSIINGSYGLVIAVGLFFIGVPNAFLWGLLATLLRFIPYVGPWLGALMPIAMSLAVSDNWMTPLMTLAMFVVMELIANNVVEPWLYGSGTGISTVAILVGAVFWTWMWGPVGLLLATPLTVCLVVLGRHVPRLEFLSVLLSDEPALTPAAHLYHRLLVEDDDEAADSMEAYLKNHSLAELYDDVALPALSFAERDWHRQRITQEQVRSIYATLRQVLDDLGDEHAVAGNGSVARLQALCLPARDEADELTGLMLVHLLRQQGVAADVVPVALLSAERIAAVEQHQPTLACISALPPSTLMHARHLCRQLRTRYPQLKLIVGLWTSADARKLREKLRCAPGEQIATTLTQAVQLIASHAKPAAERASEKIQNGDAAPLQA